MTKKNLITAPYYDDFAEDAGFHQILFKPGVSVQSRELTQAQSITRNQISKFGGHIFKHGSVVVPGNSASDLNVCYVKLGNTAYDVSTLVGKDVVGSITGLKAKIRFGVSQTETPATLYVSYYNSGAAGEKVFSPSETLTVEGIATVFTTATVAPCGGASMAFVNKGVFFVNGSFVTVLPQSIVLGETTEPSCHVMLRIDESIVTSDNDETLLDPAQGSYNYAAPGADRLKISLTLVKLPLGSALSDDYIELMRFDTGVLLEHSRYPKYNELEKSLARRTFDEAGDYVVNGLTTKIREHLKTDLNGGKFASPVGDVDKMIYTVSPGKAYIKGFENERLGSTEIVANKARGAEHISNIVANLVPSFGQFLYVSNITSLPDFDHREVITLHSATSAGSVIGTARVIAVDYLESNTTDNNAIYKLFVSDVAMTGGNSTASIGRVSYSSGSMIVLHKVSVSMSSAVDFVNDTLLTSGSRIGTIHKFSRTESTLYIKRHTDTVSLPIANDSATSPQSSCKVLSVDSVGKNANDNMLIKLPTNSTYRVKGPDSAPNISYKIYHKEIVNIVGGEGAFSVSGMTIDPKEVGNFIITSAAGIHPISVVTISPDGLTASFSGVTPTSTTLHVICAATKTGANGAPKTKTYSPAYSESGLTPASVVPLEMADIIRIKSITSTVNGDVTDRFKLDNGQRDYAYLTGSLVLTGTLPTGTLTVVYDYFTHNAGSGDYFSVDSYEFSGLENYYENSVLSYKSINTGKVYDLRDVLDFRSKLTGASTSATPQVDSRITTGVQQYVGRIDAIVMGKGGTVSAITGTPAKLPKTPSIPTESLHLASIRVSPYTFNVMDNVVTPKSNRGYTMRDVGAIDARVKNLEDYVLLTQSETSAVNYDIIDAATGLSRFKSGYLVDSFNNADTIADVHNPEFTVTYASGVIIPQFESIFTPLTLVSTTAQTTNNVVTMPYTSAVLASQPMSSRITNINPFSVFSWKGNMNLVPSKDSWVTVEELPDNYTSSVETVYITRPYVPPVPPSSSASFHSSGSVVDFTWGSVGTSIVGDSWGQVGSDDGEAGWDSWSPSSSSSIVGDSWGSSDDGGWGGSSSIVGSWSNSDSDSSSSGD